MGSRRSLLKTVGIAFAGTSIAGCGQRAPQAATATADEGGSAQDVEASAATAVAAEWAAIRARLHDTVALGAAGAPGAGAATAERISRRFESVTGTWSPREQLRSTNERVAASVETALADLASALSDGDVSAAREAAERAENGLRSAQIGRTAMPTAEVLSLAVFASRARDVEFLAAAGAVDAAAAAADRLEDDFERASAHDALESAGSEYYEGFEGTLAGAVSAAESGDAETARTQAREAARAATEAGYELVSERVAGVAHLAALQAAGWDAAAATRLGGPTAAFGHGAVLSSYRARVADAVWLYERGATERATAAAEAVFAHFEGARAHEALEEANHEAYEGFEHEGLEGLLSAIEADDAEGVAAAASTVHESLLSGIGSLAGPEERALLESGFFRARLGDARELLEAGESAAAASVTTDLFERFEADEAGFHEALEEADEALYERFEHEHLESLLEALENGDAETARTHLDGAQEALLDFERRVGTAAHVAGAEATYLTGRAFDAAAVAGLGDAERAETVAREAFAFYEAGAGGFHEALEDADEERYHAFEEALVAVGDAAAGDADPFAAAKASGDEAAAAVYAVVGASGGSADDAAASLGRGVFAAFERAPVHDVLEDADHETYESFEAALNDYVSALDGGDGVDAAAAAFGNAALAAAFAVVGASDDTPDVPAVEASDAGESEKPAVTGGPDVVEGVPDDADHVVDMTAVDFEPERLAVNVGDTVAWTYAEGEPHTVTAYEDEIPEGATYWASGGFESERAAREGWEERKGGVADGQSYVHTFETAGTHAYFCVPHEMAGMVGEVVVEE